MPFLKKVLKIEIAKPCLAISGCLLWGLLLLTTIPPNSKAEFHISEMTFLKLL